MDQTQPRQLHLLGATSMPTVEMIDGREHLVVPVIALMEGVIHAVNAETPEFVSADTLKDAADSWNGKPVTLGHPVKNGTQCSAQDPAILEAHGIGVLRNSKMAGTKMCMEALVDLEKLRRLGHQALEQVLRAGKSIEVSVGALVNTDSKAGWWLGKAFKAAWRKTVGDHLAFLPQGRGACSLEMGCGTHRAAMHLVTAEGFEALPISLPALAFSALEGEALDQRMQAVYAAVSERWAKTVEQVVTYASTLQVFDDRAIVQNEGELFSVPYRMEGGKAVLGEPTKVKQAYVAAAGSYVDCDACDGTGQVKKDGKQEDCPACHGKGEVRAAQARALLGRRNSSKDAAIIQGMHDHAVMLGAACDSRSKAQKMLGLEEGKMRAATIRHEGGKWVLYSKDGSKKLGTHDTEKDAKEQEQAIEAAKHRRAMELGGNKAALEEEGRCKCGGHS